MYFFSMFPTITMKKHINWGPYKDEAKNDFVWGICLSSAFLAIFALRIWQISFLKMIPIVCCFFFFSIQNFILFIILSLCLGKREKLVRKLWRRKSCQLRPYYSEKKKILNVNEFYAIDESSLKVIFFTKSRLRFHNLFKFRLIFYFLIDPVCLLESCFFFF